MPHSWKPWRPSLPSAPELYARLSGEDGRGALQRPTTPTIKPLVVLAALRQKMLALARDKADGAHPYFVPPEHTRRARTILGPGTLLAPAQAVMLETDPRRARAAERAYMRTYVPRLPNYANNLRELGYTEADFADGCGWIGWSMTLWRGAVSTPSKPASRRITMPGQIMCAFCPWQPRGGCRTWRLSRRSHHNPGITRVRTCP